MCRRSALGSRCSWAIEVYSAASEACRSVPSGGARVGLLRRRPAGRLLLLIVLMSPLMSCSHPRRDTVRPPHRSSQSSPFRVRREPPGYRLVAAGEGTQSQQWGEDSFGTHEPFTVLAPARETADSRSSVVVSVSGFRGYEGGLSQASPGGTSESFLFEGRPAVYAPEGQGNLGQPWADLVAARGEDLAVRVTARHATRSRLVEVLSRVRPDADHARAPAVPDPPRGLRVVGSADAGAVIAVAAYPNKGEVPGPSDSHSAGWIRGEERITVMTLPGRVGNLEALVNLVRFFPGVPPVVRHERVGGKEALVLDLGFAPEVGRSLRALITVTAWGDLLFVVGQGTPMRSVRSVVDIAESVRPVDEQAWQRFVARVR
jgi:hypothetical protein